MMRAPYMPEVLIREDSEALALAAADRLVEIGSQAVKAKDRFNLVLAGGSTPQVMYQTLVSDEFRQQLDWKKVHFSWGDERCVPPDDPLSNYRMARQALLDPLAIPEENIHRMAGELEPDLAAKNYSRELQHHFGQVQFPLFDFILLGMGQDGHTASLFPGSRAVLEREKWVVAVEHVTPPPPLVPRITLTVPVINAAAHILFLVSGDEKAEILGRVFQREAPDPDLPVSMIHPKRGSLTWMVDRAAAAGLTESKKS